MGSPGLDSQAGGGQAAVDQVGPVLDFLQLALDDADQAGLIGGGEARGTVGRAAAEAVVLWGGSRADPP